MITQFRLLWSLLLLGFATSSLPAREWTRASDGAKIEGEFVRMKNPETVYIARDGGATVEIAVATLSAEDQAFLKEKMAASPSESGLAEKEAASVPSGETEVTLTGVHLCCGGCEKGVEDAISGMEEVKLDFSSDVVTVSAGSGREVQKALDAIAKAGYYGISSNEAVAMPTGKASDSAADEVSVSGVHLCCGKCVKAIDSIVASVEGAEKHTAEKGADTFTITGTGIKPSAVLAALQAEGMSGKVE